MIRHSAVLFYLSLCMYVFQQSHSLLDKSDIVRHVCTNAPSSQQFYHHHIDVTMTTVASQITSLAVVYSIVYSDADERKHQSSASLAFVRGIHRSRWIPRTKGQWRGKCLDKKVEIKTWVIYWTPFLGLNVIIYPCTIRGTYPVRSL